MLNSGRSRTRCVFSKSLYGLKHSQAVVQVVRLFSNQGQIYQCEYDSCVYFKQNDDPTYLLLYMDDMLFAARKKAHIQKLKAQLKKKFDMKDLRESNILGMEIT